MGDLSTIWLAAGAAAAALTWALALAWRDLLVRRYPPYTALQRAAGELDAGEAASALRSFRRASRAASRHGDLAALAAAWRGIARARDALGDATGAQAAKETAEDAARQLSARAKKA